jgi:hypothetical protein
MILVPLLADGASVAMLPEIESGRFLGRGTLGAMFAERLRIVVNQVDPQARLSAAVADTLVRWLGARAIGLVARDEAVAEALASEALLADHAPRSRAAQDLADVARAVHAALPAATPDWGASPQPLAGAAPPPPFSAASGWGAR